MPAFMPGGEGIANDGLGMKWVLGYPTNNAIGLPAIHGILLLNDPSTGVPTGILDAGLSRDMDPQWLADYRAFSALRRLGTPAEVARVALWLALENSYMTGRVVTANGGL